MNGTTPTADVLVGSNPGPSGTSTPPPDCPISATTAPVAMCNRQTSVDRQTLRVAPSLELAVTWRRKIRAGIERIWENVFDWEHLPVLHEMYFDAVELIEIGYWGWRVALTKHPGTLDRRMVLELWADRENARYRVQTLSGDGAGTEIWTLLTPAGPRRTAVEVRYYLPERHPRRLAALAGKCRASCAQLWDEDEAMMVRREEMTARAAKGRPGSGAAVSLGPLAELRRPAAAYRVRRRAVPHRRV